MKKATLVAALMAALFIQGCGPTDADDISAKLEWDAVSQLVNGDPLPPEYVYYRAYELTLDVEVCVTAETSCAWMVDHGQCYEFGATATDTRTNLTSLMSSTVAWCAPEEKSPPVKVENLRIAM